MHRYTRFALSDIGPDILAKHPVGTNCVLRGQDAACVRAEQHRWVLRVDGARIIVVDGLKILQLSEVPAGNIRAFGVKLAVHILQACDNSYRAVFKFETNIPRQRL